MQEIVNKVFKNDIVAVCKKFDILTPSDASWTKQNEPETFDKFSGEIYHWIDTHGKTEQDFYDLLTSGQIAQTSTINGGLF